MYRYRRCTSLPVRLDELQSRSTRLALVLARLPLHRPRLQPEQTIRTAASQTRSRKALPNLTTRRPVEHAAPPGEPSRPVPPDARPGHPTRCRHPAGSAAAGARATAPSPCRCSPASCGPPTNGTSTSLPCVDPPVAAVVGKSARTGAGTGGETPPVVRITERLTPGAKTVVRLRLKGPVGHATVAAAPLGRRRLGRNARQSRGSSISY